MKKIIVLLSALLCVSLSACSLNTDDFNTFIYDNFVPTSAIEETAEISIAEHNADENSYEVVRVVDGDTFIILDGDDEVRVRLIGVDTPESVSKDSSKNCEYGKTASKYTYNLLTGKDVVLEYDKEKNDYYGRLLAYVYVDGKMLNYNLVSNGYAVAKEYQPNVKYSDIFTSAQIKAQQNKVGMWSDDVSEQECNLKSKYYINY